MAQERSATPEKQLLKLIETPKESSGGAVEQKALKHRGMSFLSMGAWLGRLSFFKAKIRTSPGANLARSLDLRAVNALLLVSIFGLAAYYATSVTGSFVKLRKLPELDIKMQSLAAAGPGGDVSLLKGETFYLDLIRQRNIFKIGQRIQKVVEETGPKQASPVIVEATKNLQLVGISWGDSPDAMIEDTKSLRTYFVKTGQMVGELRVQAIFKDRVVLSYQGEEIELK